MCGADQSGRQILEPEFEYGVSLNGHITAHVKPTVTFGIDWNKKFASLDSCAVNLVADGYVTFHASAETGSSSSKFCYGVDVGANLYATVDAPDMFSWVLPESPFMITETSDVTIFPSGKSETCTSPSTKTSRRRDNTSRQNRSNTTSSLSKRATRYGPLVPEIEGLLCPGEVNYDEIPSCEKCGSDSDGDDSLKKRDEVCWLDPYRSNEPSCDLVDDASVSRRSNHLEARGSPKEPLRWVMANGLTIKLSFPDYPTCSVGEGKGVHKWWGFKPDEKNKCDVVLRKRKKNELDKEIDYVSKFIYSKATVKGTI